jgi:hypothetical protein
MAMAVKQHKTLADWMVIAISPVLIMTLVGSLLFFLLAMLDVGQYGARLSFIFAMFVMAIVLIARISMEEGTEYATLFALPLALVTMMALVRFVRFEGPLGSYSIFINAFLMGLVWWCAHKLTWDCTLIDERQDSSGEGLLQVSRLESSADAASAEKDRLDEEDVTLAAEMTAAERRDRPLLKRLTERRQRPHAPGVWIIYFSLVALPIFGIGQTFISAEHVEARRYGFMLFCVFVASALGLLSTTSFLGLRRYLRQRNLQMPLDMAGVWLVAGALLIVTLLGVTVLLPRPGAEVAASQPPFSLESLKDLATNRFAVGRDGTKTGERAQSVASDEKSSGSAAKPSRDNPSGDSSGDSKNGQNGQATEGSSQSGGNQSAERQQPSQSGAGPRRSQGDQRSPSDGVEQNNRTADQSEGSGPTGSQASASNQPQQAQRMNPSSDRGAESSQDSNTANQDSSNGQTGQSANSQQQSADSQQNNGAESSTSQNEPQSGGGNQSSARDQGPQSSDVTNSPRDGGRQPSDSSQSPSANESDSDQSSESSSGDQPQSQGTDAAEPNDSESGGESDGSSPTDSQVEPESPSDSFSLNGLLDNMTAGLGKLIRFAFFLLLIAAAAFLLWKYRSALWEGWCQLWADLRKLLERLLGRELAPANEAATEQDAASASRRPFAAYADPFLSGDAAKHSTEQLVRYSFEALEAWAAERECGRDVEQTPIEFAQQLGTFHPRIGRETQLLADVYSRIAYGRERVPDYQKADLRQLWEELRASPPPVHST